MDLFLSRLPSPLGELLLITDQEQRVRALDFADHEGRLYRGLRGYYSNYGLIHIDPPTTITTALQAYFAGDMGAVDGLIVTPLGTDLQMKVWRAVREVPGGKTTSYGALARGLGFTDPRAAIDVGAALGSNPIAIIVPCHRVVASNGDLKGFAWGLHRKRWLLEHEKAIEPEPLQTASFPGF